MSIPIPVTKTRISTTNWGIPITNEVNRLTPLVDKQATMWPQCLGHVNTTASFFNIDTSLKWLTPLELTVPARPGHVYLVIAQGDFFTTDTASYYTAMLRTGPAPGTNQIGTGSVQCPQANWGFQWQILWPYPSPATATRVAIYVQRTIGGTAGATSAGAILTVLDMGTLT